MKKNIAQDDDGFTLEIDEWKEALDQLAHDMASPISFLDQYINNLSAPKDEFALGEMDLLRNFSRSADNMEFDRHDFSETIKNAISEISPKASRHNVALSYAGPDRLVGRFDKKNVERILANLFVNAIEAMEEKGGSVVVTVLHGNGSVWIEVADDGKGIPEELAKRIFERGFTHGKKNGTGLGLAFCNKIMKAHGGSIHVYSREGRGAVFSLSFPGSTVLGDKRIGAAWANISPGEITLDPI